MQPFQAPALADQFIGQPVEQFGVGWAAAEDAEIRRRIDEPAAEMIQPDAIGEHTADQRVLAVDKMPRVSEPSARAGSLWIRIRESRTAVLRERRWSGRPAGRLAVGWR